MAGKKAISVTKPTSRGPKRMPGKETSINERKRQSSKVDDGGIERKREDVKKRKTELTDPKLPLEPTTRCSTRKRGQPARAKGSLPHFSWMLSATDEAKLEKTLNFEAFCDVKIVCGVNGGSVIKTSRLFLSGLSRFLCQVFLDHQNSATGDDDVVLMLPDVDFVTIDNFFNNVCSGKDRPAVVDPSLSFLNFGQSPSPEFLRAFSPKPACFCNKEPVGESELAKELDSDAEDTPGGFEQLSDDWLPSEKGGTSARTRLSTNASSVWRFFKRPVGGKADCKLCQVSIASVNGSTSGMIHHLQRFHAEGFAQAEAEEGARVKKSLKRQSAKKVDQKRDSVWEFFEQINSGADTRCLACGAVCSFAGRRMAASTRHLQTAHPDLHQKLSAVRDEQALAKAREKFLSSQLTDLDLAEGAGLEMSDEVVKTSPVWMIFKANESNNSDSTAQCLLCDEKLSFARNSTEPLIRHVQVSHESNFSQLKSKLENPDLPEILDPANPLWEFFSTADEKQFAQCNTCLEILPIQESNSDNLRDHLSNDHPEIREALEERIQKWCQLRREELLVYQECQTRKTKPLQQVWNYFDRTSDRHVVVCKKCEVRIPLEDRGLAEINRHVEQNHPDAYGKFLADTTTIKRVSPPADDVTRRTCPVCQKVCNSRANMRRHLKCSHPKDQSYQCHVCGKTFGALERYKSHNHIAAKTYLCSHCGKPFSTRHGRKMHEKSHLAEERELFMCKFCHKGFTTKDNRRRHEKIHSDEKPFQCNLCSKAFLRGEHLKFHLLTHSGEKPLSCDDCGMKFKYYKNKNMHKCGIRQPVGQPQVVEQRSNEASTEDEDDEEENSSGSWE